jgi:hypothetical protein
MNSNDQILIVLKDEVNAVFGRKCKNKPLSELGLENIDIINNAGNYLYEEFGNEIFTNKIFGHYLYYLDNHFFELCDSYLKNNKRNTDISQRLKQIKFGNPFYFFVKYGYCCILMMSEEMQKAVLIEKKYDLFWNEFYHFLNRLKYENELMEKERIQDMMVELRMKGYINSPNIESFLFNREEKRIKGKPAKINQDILLKFADLLEENRNNKKKNTLEKMMCMASDDKLEWTAIRNWLRNHMPLLQKTGMSIKDLTKDEILVMWNDYQYHKNV